VYSKKPTSIFYSTSDETSTNCKPNRAFSTYHTGEYFQEDGLRKIVLTRQVDGMAWEVSVSLQHNCETDAMENRETD
jgi:hypothetical protein